MEMETNKFEAQFRTLIFANDRKLYYEMFERADMEARQEIEDEAEWIVPDSEEEIEALLRELPIPD